MLTQQEKVDLYKKSRKKCTRKQAQMVLGDNNKYYTATGHMKYFD